MLDHLDGLGVFEQLPQAALVVIAAVLLLLELALLIALIARGAGPSLRRLATWLGAGAPLLTVALMIGIAHLGRAEMMEAVEGIDPASRATLLRPCMGLCLSGAGLELGGLALAALGLAGGLLVALAWRGSSEGSARRLATVAGPGLGLVVALAGVGLAGRYISMLDGFTVVAGVDPARKLELLGPVLQGGDRFLQLLLGCSGAVLVLTCVASLVVILRAKADELRVGPGVLVIGALALACGAGAFGLTRPHARDLAGPLPTQGAVGSTGGMISHDHLVLPELEHGHPFSTRPPAVTMTHPEEDPGGGVVTVDGSEVATVRELLTSPPGQTITRLMERLRDHHRRWKMINPNRPYPAEVMLLAHRETPGAAVETVLASVLAARHDRVQLVSGVPMYLESAVLGRQQNTRYIAVAFGLVDRATPGALTLRRGERLQALAARIDAAVGQGRPVSVGVRTP